MGPKTSSRKVQGKILGVILCLSFFVTLSGCGDDQTKGPAQQAGEKIDKAIQETGDSMKEAMEKTEAAVNEAAESAGKAVNEAVEGAEEKLNEMGEGVKETTQETIQSAEKIVGDSSK